MNIGLMIATERTKQNLSTKKLAEVAGCSSRAIEYWEAGKRKISFEYAEKIFEALGKTITIGAKNNEIRGNNSEVINACTKEE